MGPSLMLVLIVYMSFVLYRTACDLERETECWKWHLQNMQCRQCFGLPVFRVQNGNLKREEIPELLPLSYLFLFPLFKDCRSVRGWEEIPRVRGGWIKAGRPNRRGATGGPNSRNTCVVSLQSWPCEERMAVTWLEPAGTGQLHHVFLRASHRRKPLQCPLEPQFCSRPVKDWWVE